MKWIIFFLLVCGSFIIARSQDPSVYISSDPAAMASRVPLDFDSYFFFSNDQFYAVRLGFLYGLQNERNLVGLSIPFVHNIFASNYGGFENTTGIGDIKMTYTGVPYYKKNGFGLNRVSAFFELSAPTGESRLGRGAGAWLYKPGLIFTYRLSPELALYPEVKYQFSFSDANSTGGSGNPDPEDPEKDGKVNNLNINLPVVIVIDQWDGWFSLSARYLQSFSAKEAYFFLGMDLGKMLGDKSSAALNISKFIAGQPRLNVLVQVKFQFLL